MILFSIFEAPPYRLPQWSLDFMFLPAMSKSSSFPISLPARLVFHLPDDSHCAWNEPGTRSTALLQILVSTLLLDNTMYSIRVLLCTSQHVAEFLLQAFSSCGTDEWESKKETVQLDNHRLRAGTSVPWLGQFL